MMVVPAMLPLISSPSLSSAGDGIIVGASDSGGASAGGDKLTVGDEAALSSVCCNRGFILRYTSGVGHRLEWIEVRRVRFEVN